ncbi:tetratricopeptide repeat protein [Cyanobacterium sp. uoEpiScrs1]|uniref:tetratricopeptide repeat protein n=1 Tax=Cyanobacterium sp. uoEpiScrs1 TaxID=2976343 RepID=UPI00226ABD50|nr:tetratricopeptide repeat protein [Cyanobacterium sp. uoEpiScrs1]
MTTLNQEQFQFKSQVGRDLLERGQYHLSVQVFEEITESIDLSSRLGGEVQIWLVTAYQAAGRLQDAIVLCQTLTCHPYSDIKKRGQEILYILRAPKLKRPKEWMIKIPTLEVPIKRDSKYVSTKSMYQLQKESVIISEDLSQMNTKDNYFLGIALVFLILVLCINF